MKDRYVSRGIKQKICKENPLLEAMLWDIYDRLKEEALMTQKQLLDEMASAYKQAKDIKDEEGYIDPDDLCELRLIARLRDGRSVVEVQHLKDDKENVVRIIYTRRAVNQKVDILELKDKVVMLVEGELGQ